jgi:hypothetical protein
MSILDVKFIGPDFVKNNTPIELNVDDTKINPFITISQDTHIQLVLGSTLYNRLKQGVVNNDLNSDEVGLIQDYIAPCLAQWTYYEAYPFLNIKSTNKGNVKENSEWSTNSELDEIKFMRNAIRDMAEFYLKRLSKYLCDFSELFPQYNNPDPKENVLKNSKSYFTGVYTRRRAAPVDMERFYDRTRDCDNCGENY